MKLARRFAACFDMQSRKALLRSQVFLGSYSLSLVMLVLIFSQSAFAAEAIVWHNLDSALEINKESHKLILVDLYTDWCVYCKKLDQNTYTNLELIDYLVEKFVCVKENAEKSRTGRAIQKAYKVTGFPCSLLFDEKGTFLGKFEGYTNSQGYKIMVERTIAAPKTVEQTNLNSLVVGFPNSKTRLAKGAIKTSADSTQSDPASKEHKATPTIKSLIGKFY